MTLFLVFDTLAAADAAERIVFERGAQIAALNGYTLDEAGGIVGMTPAGEVALEAARTTRWDVPRQRLDGRWVFTHPQHHPAAREPAWLFFVMQGLDAPAEQEAATWWPVTDEA
ncbi:hypothetical protein [Antarcticirhabdus aurantiaca]|uniref:hypothetical protein n=1 Tax=Antarcticirhabdus aurantiaca TaxID=2606717 RepID=UPI00131EC295|nr:hypothetical protein [Antarcticirhabdus aurantiaca]